MFRTKNTKDLLGALSYIANIVTRLKVFSTSSIVSKSSKVRCENIINAQNIFVTSQGAMYFVDSRMLTLGNKLHQASQLLSKFPISVHNLIFK